MPHLKPALCFTQNRYTVVSMFQSSLRNGQTLVKKVPLLLLVCLFLNIYLLVCLFSLGVFLYFDLHVFLILKYLFALFVCLVCVCPVAFRHVCSDQHNGGQCDRAFGS